MFGLTVAKFGGSSLADYAQLQKVKAIVERNPAIRYVVVSAPGARHKADPKVTDLLGALHEALSTSRTKEVRRLREELLLRFKGLAHPLASAGDIAQELDALIASSVPPMTREYVMSRGEYWCARIVAAELNATFVDATEFIAFDARGKLAWKKTGRNRHALLGRGRLVIPGFYGLGPRGVTTFKRGGSDITGAIVAALGKAAVYENWTDVSGILAADPRVVRNPRSIPELSRRELRELTYRGASVFHDEAIRPLVGTDVVVNIRNTNDPAHPGTRITPDGSPLSHGGAVTGIAGKKGLSTVSVQMMMMGDEPGYARKMLSALEKHRLNIERIVDGTDSLTAIVSTQALNACRENLQQSLMALRPKPDSVIIRDEFALITVVGRNMKGVPGTLEKHTRALTDANINIRSVDQDINELSFSFGVNEADYEKATQALYRTATH